MNQLKKIFVNNDSSLVTVSAGNPISDPQAKWEYGTSEDLINQKFAIKDAEIDEKIEEQDEIISGYDQRINLLQNNKADKSTTINGYGITNAYTKTEVNNIIQEVQQAISLVDTKSSNAVSSETSRAQSAESALGNRITSLTQSDIVVVADHTQVSSLDATTIYREYGTTSYADWMYQNNTWQKMAEYNNALANTLNISTGDNIPTSEAVIKEIKPLSPSTNMVSVKAILRNNTANPTSLKSDSNSESIIIPTDSAETVIFVPGVSSTYCCFASDFNFSDNTFTRVSWLERDRGIQIDPETGTAEYNLKDGVHTNANFLIVTVNLSGSLRPLTSLIIDGIDYFKPLLQRVITLETRLGNKDAGYIKEFSLSHLGNVVTINGESVVMPKVILTNDSIDSYLGWTSVIKIRSNLYYMYYDSVKQNIGNAEVRGEGLSFAYSTDGLNWTKGFPSGESRLNVIFPLIEDEENNTSYYKMRSCTGACVVKVNDSQYPYRLFGNVATDGTDASISDYKGLYMWKSADGINFGDFEDDGILVTAQKMDTQYSVIPCGGNILKIYCRKRRGSNVRNIGVLFVDIDGNVVSPSTTLFGDYFYNPAAYKIDDKRELLLPTYYDPNTQNCYYKSFIVNGENYQESSSINETLKVKGEGANWNYSGIDLDTCFGIVGNGFILIDDNQYIVYTQRNYSHSSTPPSGAQNIDEVRIVKINWITNGYSPI